MNCIGKDFLVRTQKAPVITETIDYKLDFMKTKQNKTSAHSSHGYKSKQAKIWVKIFFVHKPDSGH